MGNGLNFTDIFEFVKKENEYLTKLDNLSSSKERILAQSTKLLEECGEFASEVMI